MKIKPILIALSLIAGIFLSIFFYYRFDPSLLTRLSFYAELADPFIRIVRVDEGLRAEQVADLVGDKLDWDQQQKDEFLTDSVNVEGHLFPKTYLIDQNATPATVAATMTDAYTEAVTQIKKPAAMQIINGDTALKIASIIQRESGGKSDMNLISGIIWNRLFDGMNLQMDATLQYAKGTEEAGWWGPVAPVDKSIESPYNTYLYEGLPPGPISNPGIDAIAAAFNPAKTSCIFYIHDHNHKIHCSATYAGQVANINTYLK